MESSELFADLLREIARALGKPTDGEGSGWADMPELVQAMREAIEYALANIEYLQKLWGKEAVTDQIAARLRDALRVKAG